MRTKSGLNLLLAILVATFLFAHAGAATKPSLKSKSQSRKKAGAHARLLKSLRARKAKRVFVASADLRPMAQQLMEARTPGAYAGVEKIEFEGSQFRRDIGRKGVRRKPGLGVGGQGAGQ